MKNIYIPLLWLSLIILSGCTSGHHMPIEKAEASDFLTQEVQQISQPAEDVVLKPEEQEDIYGPLSLENLKKQDIQGSDLRIESVLKGNSNYSRYSISYLSGDLRISGVMNIPKGKKIVPLVILAHGYVDIRFSSNGQGLRREQDYFANNGFAIIQPDYRNHALSDNFPEDPYDFRFGYTKDVIASVLAAQSSNIPELANVDTMSVGLLGHSMGGGIAQNISVIRPDLLDAIVLYGPVHNRAYENFLKYQINNWQRIGRVRKILNEYGNFEKNPNFWNGISAHSFLQDVKTPIQLYIGTNDKKTPYKWAQQIEQDLLSHGKDVELFAFPNETHVFWSRWEDFIEGSAEFFHRELEQQPITKFESGQF